MIAACRNRPDAEIEIALNRAGIPFCPVFDGMMLAETPYFRARGDVIAEDHPVVGRVSAPGAIHGGQTPVFHPPALGEANREIFAGMLGLSDAALAQLAAAGVI
jgi:formyl-CoA transferase